MHKDTQLILNKTIGIFGEDLRGNHMFDYRLCLTALVHVQYKISTTLYPYLKAHDPYEFNRQISSDTQILEQEIGICGDHVEAFLFIMKDLGYKGRDIQIYYYPEGQKELNSHVVAEIYFGNSWRMFDITWGWHPYLIETEQVISFDDLAKKEYKICQNQLDPWTNNSLRNSGIQIFEYTHNPLAVLYNLGGEISIDVPTQQKNNLITDGLPKLLGSIRSYSGELDLENRLMWTFNFKDKVKRKFILKLKPLSFSSTCSTSIEDVHVKIGNKKYAFNKSIDHISDDDKITIDLQSISKGHPYCVLEQLSYSEC